MLDGHRKCLHDCTFVRFIFDPRQTATQGKLVSYAMKFGLYSVRHSVWGKGEKIARREKRKGESL